jgi:translocation and assembly module TamA
MLRATLHSSRSPASRKQTRFFAACCLVICCVLTACATKQAGPADPDASERRKQTEAAAPAAFTLKIEAPKDVRELLEKHLDLQRYRAVPDLNEAELARLLVTAEANARELVATLGYFSPDIRIERDSVDAATAPLPVAAASSAAPVAANVPQIRMFVVPGEPTRVASVQLDVTGDMASNPAPDVTAQRDALKKDWSLPAGRRFTQADWGDAKTNALRDLTARRYLAGRVAGSRADIDPDKREAALGVTLDSGPVYLLGPLEITGLSHYSPTLVERFARLTPGAVYDRDELLRAQQRLSDSGFFDSAFLLVDPDADPKAAPVQTQLREAKLQKLVLGVGLTTDSGPRFSAEHTHNQVPLIGWRAVSKFQVDQKNQYLGSEIMSQPDSSYWRWVVGGKLQRERDDPLTTTSQQVRVGRLQTSDRLDRSVYVQYDRALVRGGDATVDTGSNNAISLAWAWTQRNFDNVLYPTRGWGLGVEFGPGLTLGSAREPFLRGLLRLQGYVPLDALGERSGRLSLRGQAGAVVAKAEAPIPATQQFLTGGDTTVRGYTYRSIGVETSTGIVQAGRYLAAGSVEWQRPIYKDDRPTDWETAVFVDSGAVADQVGKLSPSTGVGVGARWRSPIGPFQADVAYGIEAKAIRLHISVGFTF